MPAPDRNTLLTPPPAEKRRDPSLVPFLSIQLLILAFFIILTSHATLNDEKVRSVTESVQQHFAGIRENVTSGPQGGPLEPEARSALRNVMVSFQGLVPLDSSVRQLSALEQTIRLPADLFFAQDSADLLESRRSLIEEVMRALDLRPRGWGYELELLLQGDPPDTLTITRAATLAEALAGDGSPQGSTVVAMGQGDPGWLVLLVRLRPNEGAEVAP